MFFLHRFKIVFFFFLLALATEGFSQKTLNRLIVGSGGAFSNPNDFVSLSAYSPADQSTTFIGEIKTQSIQDLILDGNRIFVAATDSIVCFNAETFEKTASVAVPGVRYLLVVNDLLFVSIQYPETSNFVKIYNKNTLEFITAISQVSTETAGMLWLNDKVYVAVPGDWTSTEGKLAILNAADGAFIEEIDYSTQGVGIHDLFTYQNKLLSVQRSAWGTTSGVLSVFDPADRAVQNFPIASNVGKGVGILNNLLYVILDNGLGTINLSTFEVESPVVIPDPGSASYINFADIVLDTIGQRLYATTTDYFSMGAGYIYDLSGNQTGTFEAGISAEALALDYGNVTAVKTTILQEMTLYPNPVKDILNVSFLRDADFVRLEIIGCDGKLLHSQILADKDVQQLNVSELAPGIYLLRLISGNGNLSQTKMVKL